MNVCVYDAHVYCVADCTLEGGSERTQAGGVALSQSVPALLCSRGPGQSRGQPHDVGRLIKSLAWQNAGLPLRHLGGDDLSVPSER